MNCPWNSDARPEPTTSGDADRGVLNELDGNLNEEEVEKALDGIPDVDQGSEAAPVLEPIDDTSFEPSAAHEDVWSLKR